jgi:hypothetical protein
MATAQVSEGKLMELEDYRSKVLTMQPMRAKLHSLHKQKTTLALKLEALENYQPMLSEIKASNSKLETMYQEQTGKIVALEKAKAAQ